MYLLYQVKIQLCQLQDVCILICTVLIYLVLSKGHLLHERKRSKPDATATVEVLNSAYASRGGKLNDID